MIGIIFGGALVAVGILYGLACDLCRWFDNAERVRMSDVVQHFTEPVEDDRMETLRRQLDEVWEDEEDPRRELEQEACMCEACMWSEIAELELLFALPAREPRRVR